MSNSDPSQDTPFLPSSTSTAPCSPHFSGNSLSPERRSDMDPPCVPRGEAGDGSHPRVHPKEQPGLSGLTHSLPPSFRLLGAGLSLVGWWGELSLQDLCPGSPRQARWGLTLPGLLLPSLSLSPPHTSSSPSCSSSSPSSFSSSSFSSSSSSSHPLPTPFSLSPSPFLPHNLYLSFSDFTILSSCAP